MHKTQMKQSGHRKQGSNVNGVFQYMVENLEFQNFSKIPQTNLVVRDFMENTV